jgi:metal-sulfur cluster biosynthetic enzyme
VRRKTVVKVDIEELKKKFIEELKKIYDPEIPANIYDLGLIYKIDFKGNEYGKIKVEVDMTLTSAFCPVSDYLVQRVKEIKEVLDEIEEIDVNLVFDPPWDQSKMSDEAKLQLGML